MSWLDEFFDAMGQAPITTTFGPVPTIAITPATDTAAGSMSAADKAKLDGMGGQVAAGATAPATPGVGTAPATLCTVTIPTGYDAVVSLDVMAKVTGGSGAGGNVGKRLALATKLLFVNPSGTPAAGSGVLSPTGGVYWSYDEMSGFLEPTPFSFVFTPNSVTVKIASIANVNVDWSAVVTSVSLLQE